jgi:hypothetical protein
MRAERVQGDFNSWSIGQVRPPNYDSRELEVERLVSYYLGQMFVLWLNVPDEPSSFSDRAYLEQNIIACLATANRKVPAQSGDWLGNYSDKAEIRLSGLWNVDHVDRVFDQRSLDILEQYVDITTGTVPLPQASIAPADWKQSQSNLALPLDLPTQARR